MLILSQDKATILNFNKVVCLSVNLEKDNKAFVNYQTENEYFRNLAIYDTKERAEEILQEIINKYEFSYRMRNSSATILGLEDYSIYKMPQN